MSVSLLCYVNYCLVYAAVMSAYAVAGLQVGVPAFTWGMTKFLITYSIISRVVNVLFKSALNAEPRILCK